MFTGNLISTGLKLRSRWREDQRRRALDDPQATQERQFQALLEKGRQTEWGREHGYDKVKTVEDFQHATPISDYLKMAPWWQRYFDGEHDLTWPGRPSYFAQTSGTTAGDKYIPVTDEMMLSNRKAALDIFSMYARRGPEKLSGMWQGKLLMLGGSTSLEEREHGIKVGDLSGISNDSVFWPLSQHLHPKKETALLGNWEEKLEQVAQEVAHEDIRFMTGMPSWVKMLMDRVAEIRGIAPEALTKDVWPNFSLLVHGGVNFTPYRGAFEKFWQLGGAPDFLEVYPASEGFLGIQSAEGDPGLELFIDNGIFYEFVPLSEWGTDNPTRLQLHEVELDEPYVVLLTTNAGAWSYDLGDVVRFTSLHPPKVVINGRHRHFINAFGENVIGEHLERALTYAQEQTSCRIAEFTAGPVYISDERATPCHEYIIEFVDQPAELDRFTEALDQEMRRQSHDYDVKRTNNVGMTRPLVRIVPPTTFQQWMKARGKLGGQNKVPRCANHRDYLDQLIELSGGGTTAPKPELVGAPA